MSDESTRELTAISVVAPFFNEQAVLPEFCAQVRKVLDDMETTYDVVLVDDGSSDDSVAFLRTLAWPQCTVIRLMTNAGHQDALDAGLRSARGRWVVTMDADLQHPPELIPRLLSTAQAEGSEVVYAVRPDRREEPARKRWTASLYYRLMRRLTGVDVTPNAADFRLMSRRVVDVVNSVPDRKVFRLLLPSLGFPSSTVPYQAAERAAGDSKYSLARMVKLAGRSVLEFSARPLQIASVAGLIFSAVSLLWLIYVVVQFALHRTVDGWASLAAITLLVGGVQLLTVGVLGTYVGRLYEASKGRPRFIVSESFRLESPGVAEPPSFTER